MERLNQLEHLALNLLFDGDHPALRQLREQIKYCQVRKREFTGVGFFAELCLSNEAPSAPLRNESIRFGDVVADIVGVEAGVGFLVYIDHGRVTALEGYTFGESWPEDALVKSMDYSKRPRDLSSLF